MRMGIKFCYFDLVFCLVYDDVLNIWWLNEVVNEWRDKFYMFLFCMILLLWFYMMWSYWGIVFKLTYFYVKKDIYLVKILGVLFWGVESRILCFYVYGFFCF